MRVLYLEDCEDKISKLRQCVNSLGYTLRTCSTVSAALDELERSSFDLVMSAVHLKIDSALDLVRSIRKNPKHANLPIILIDSHQTAVAKSINDSVEVAAQTLGVTEYLAMSDFDPKRVCDVVLNTMGSVRVTGVRDTSPAGTRKANY